MAEFRERSTKLLPATPAAIREAAGVLREGGLVAFPTETVYGLGAGAEDPVALHKVFLAKGRPANHPVIVHLYDVAMIDELAAAVPPAARKLAEAFWPGPMTLIFRRSRRVSELVTGGLDTVGLRVPAHPVARELLREFGGPLAAPSANRFGHVSPTRAEHVLADLQGRVDLILDGGPCPVGLESTIIDCSSERVSVLRPGAVTAEQIATVLKEQVGGPAESAPRVSGSLPSHYAPRARVEIVAAADLAGRAAELAGQAVRVAVLGAERPDVKHDGVIWLAIPQDQDEFGRQLYRLLRQVDELGCDVVLATLPEEGGFGAAIADRLRRAAGPRD
jgi:L-threonylcarbamoyladenylate synthase